MSPHQHQSLCTSLIRCPSIFMKPSLLMLPLVGLASNSSVLLTTCNFQQLPLIFSGNRPSNIASNKLTDCNKLLFVGLFPASSRNKMALITKSPFTCLTFKSIFCCHHAHDVGVHQFVNQVFASHDGNSYWLGHGSQPILWLV
jgi:hypothetical protein